MPPALLRAASRLSRLPASPATWRLPATYRCEHPLLPAAAHCTLRAPHCRYRTFAVPPAFSYRRLLPHAGTSPPRWRLWTGSAGVLCRHYPRRRLPAPCHLPTCKLPGAVVGGVGLLPGLRQRAGRRDGGAGRTAMRTRLLAPRRSLPYRSSAPPSGRWCHHLLPARACRGGAGRTLHHLPATRCLPRTSGSPGPAGGWHHRTWRQLLATSPTYASPRRGVEAPCKRGIARSCSWAWRAAGGKAWAAGGRKHQDVGEHSRRNNVACYRDGAGDCAARIALLTRRTCWHLGGAPRWGGAAVFLYLTTRARECCKRDVPDLSGRRHLHGKTLAPRQ